MIQLLAEEKGDGIFQKYLKCLENEYSFWMNGVDNLDKSNKAFRRVVRLKDGEILNRYWDDKNTPRAESYLEDIKTAHKAKTLHPNVRVEDVYRNLRAAAESGWDFSSRWLLVNDLNAFELFCIHTTDIVPVDLNCLLYNLEFTIAKAYRLNANKVKAQEYEAKCKSRKIAVLKYCWSNANGFFMDYNFVQNRQTDVFSLAGVYPMFFKLADKDQALAVSINIEKSFLKEGGVVSTLNATGQQWDSPNGWAPLQWITIRGLRNYGYNSLASDIRLH